jgi:hypothetical protein
VGPVDGIYTSIAFNAMQQTDEFFVQFVLLRLFLMSYAN